MSTEPTRPKEGESEEPSGLTEASPALDAELDTARALIQADQPAATEPLPDQRREYRAFWLLLGAGWLGTNLGYYLAELPIQFVLKEELHLSADVLAGSMAMAHFTNYIKPLAGVLTDGIPFFGTRRRHYLLLGLTVCGILWFALGFVPRTYRTFLFTYAFMYIFVVLISTVLGGVMAEGGARFNATGRLSAQRISIFRIAMVAGGVLGGILAKMQFLVTTSIVAGLHLLLVPLFYFRLREKPAPPREHSAAEAVRDQFARILKARTLWVAAGLVCLVVAAPGFNTPLLYYQRDTLGFDKDFIGLLKSIGALFGFIAAGLYGLVCRRVNLRKLLAWSIVVHATGTLVYLAYRTPATALSITALEGLCQTLALMPLYDLAIRATPRGSEAMGYSVMMSVWNLTNAAADYLGSWLFSKYGITFRQLIWLNSGTTALVLFAVPFLPAALMDRREGEPVDQSRTDLAGA